MGKNNKKENKPKDSCQGDGRVDRYDTRYLVGLAESELACLQEILNTLKDIQEELRGRRTWNDPANDPSYQTPARPQPCHPWPMWPSPWCPSRTPGIDRWINNPDYTPSTTPCTPTDPYGNPVVYCKTSADGTARIN